MAIAKDDGATVLKAGFISASLAFLAALGFAVAQILQLLGVLPPPLDEIPIYGFSLFIAAPLLLAFLALHYVTPEENRFWSHAAVIFAAIYTAYVTLNYVVQLTAVLPFAAPNPALLQTPHSLFWTVDGLGYIALGLATSFAAPLFAKTGVENWLRWFFIANSAITPVIAVVYFYPRFSTALLLLASPWIVTAPGSILLLALFFRTKLEN